MNITDIKDFGPIRDDYLFFQQQSTEDSEDLYAYMRHIKADAMRDGLIHMLDFGCGDGRFSSRFLSQTRFPPERLRLSLVEPEAEYRHQAVAQLQTFTVHPVQAWPALPSDLELRFDVVLANHVFYYVPHLDNTLGSILHALNPGGLFLTAIAGQSNVLIQLATYCFALINMPYPYHTAEELEDSLTRQGVVYRKHSIQYELVFQDTEENRLKIIRFLLGSYFDAIPRQAMVDAFAQYTQSGRIVIQTGHDQFVIRH